MMVWGLVVLLFVYAAVRIDSLAILKARFAKGEISHEEFNKMKQILSQS